LPRPIFHFQWESERVQAGVHRFVQDARRDFGVREGRIHGERELGETRSLLVEVCSATGEALDYDVREVSPEMTEVMRNVPLDEGKTSLQASNDIRGADIRTRVIHDDWDSVNLVPRHTGRAVRTDKQPDEFSEHHWENSSSCAPSLFN